MEANMTIKYHNDLIQGSDEWLSARCGLLTASEMKLILTPTLKVANNEKTRAHVYEIAAQRINKYVEPAYVNDDMLRGMSDEPVARALYEQHYDLVDTCGFITSDDHGCTIGYSPDGLVGDDGLIEIKSRRQKAQLETIATDIVPDEYMMQLQTGLIITGREWIDFISYCGGMPMYVKRVYPDDEIQAAIKEAAESFESKVQKVIGQYSNVVAGLKVKTTQRTTQEESYL
jgi:predicted phage-related endonuclease